jgi:putative acetyltransferase
MRGDACVQECARVVIAVASVRGVSTSDALPSGVLIRAQDAADRAAVAAVVTAAFDDASVADLEQALAAHAHGTGYVACSGEQIVGQVRISWGWLDASDRLVDIVVLSPLSVVPARQGEGIGQALVARAVVGAEEIGAPVLVLEGDPAFYSRCGFVAASDLGIDAPSARIPDRACQAVTLPGYQPWMTGRIVYPEVFWRHDAVGLRGEQRDRELRPLGHSLAEPTRFDGSATPDRGQ